MLLASLSFRIQPYKRSEVLSAVDSLVERMRVTSGCARSRVLFDSEDANAFLVASEWDQPGAAEAFFGSREFQMFRGIRMMLRDDLLITLDDIRNRRTQLLKG